VGGRTQWHEVSLFTLTELKRDCPLVTIITPSLNQAQFIEETILSVIAQSYRRIQYVVVDGCSADGTLNILDKYRSYIDVLIHEPDSGQSDAINKGIKNAEGSILMWLNSDDILLPQSIEEAVIAMECSDSKTLMLHGHAELFGSNLKPMIIGQKTYSPRYEYPAYMCFPQPASLFKRTLIDITGLLDESLHYGMDYELAIRAYLMGNIQYLPRVLSRYRIHATSKSNDLAFFLDDWKEVFSRFLNTFPALEDWRARFVKEGMHSGTDRYFQCNQEITEVEFREILRNHLHKFAHCHYQSRRYAMARKYIDFHEKYFPDSFHKMGLDRLRLRSYIAQVLKP